MVIAFNSHSRVSFYYHTVASFRNRAGYGHLVGFSITPVSLAPKLAVWEAASWWQQGIGPVLALLQQMVYHNSVDAVFNKVVEVLLPFLRTKRKKNTYMTWLNKKKTPLLHC